MQRPVSPPRIEASSTKLSRAERIRGQVAEGLRYQQHGYVAEAGECYRHALELDPKCFDALQLLGALTFRSGKFEAGIELMRKALTLEPNHAPTLNNFANALRAAGRWREAIMAYRRAVANAPPHPMVLRNLGSALLETGEYEEAGRLLVHSRSLNNNDAELHCWIGHLCRALNRPADAVTAYRKAVSLNPSLAQAYRGMGSALRDGGLRQEAFEAFSAALQLDPALLAARILRINLALSFCRWEGWEAERATILSITPDKINAVDPATAFYLTDSRGVLRRYANAYAEQVLAQAPKLPAPKTRRSGNSERIRIAYVSGDIRDHPVAHLTAGIFARHDRTRFEIRVYAIGEDDGGPLRRRIAATCERFVPLESVSDADLASRLRADENDIVVDLMGYTQKGQPRAFAARPAPVHVSWLGYPGTLGASYVDYIIADEFVIPGGAEADYAEQIVRLPGCYQPNDCERPVHQSKTRSAYGLSEAALVLCSFNQAQKINPPLFGVWMDVLRDVPDAVLWLSVRETSVIVNLRREAEARGVAPERLVFAERVPENADHLARYRVADLALDTFPYGSHTTASDALWAGCPLIALVGESFASRVSGSVLRAAGLPELVTDSLDSYHQLILTLAGDRSRLDALRRGLAAERLSCALFDTGRFVSALEAAYTLMHGRACAGLPPIHLRIDHH
jgi:protein O-GlcNAc transferase